MPKVLIIADDLTGANATGVLLAKKGFKTGTFLNLELYPKDQKFDVVSISTDSRGISPNEAYNKVKEVADFFKCSDVKLYTKRIDSTLRGNIGNEIDAILDTLKDHIAILVASFPSSNRTSVGGYLTVNSLPLEKTSVAQDPKTPIFESYIPDVIQKQTKYPIGFIPLKCVLKGSKFLTTEITKHKEQGNKIIVIDATSNDDIEEIAKATVASNIKAISVDPGPFTSALASQLLKYSSKVSAQKTMFVIGSVTEITKLQLDALKTKYRPLTIKVSPRNLIYDHLKEQEIVGVVNQLIGQMSDYKIIGIATTKSKDDILNLSEIAKDLAITEDDVSSRISQGLGEITKRVMEQAKGVIGGLYTSGGDVTVAVCNSLSSAGIEVKDEVLPLAAYGKIIGGKYNNIPIITKGGLIGDSNSMIIALEYLSTKISTNIITNLEEEN